MDAPSIDPRDAPIASLKIVEPARSLAGPWIGQTLADLGAEVVKVEAPGGDNTRPWDPPFVERELPDGRRDRTAAYFHAANRGKHSITCDLGRPEDLEGLLQRVRQADVLIENVKIGGLRKHSLDYETLSAVNPGLVYGSVTGFGQHGPFAPLPGYDVLIQGLSGIMDLTGKQEGEPKQSASPGSTS